MSLLSMLSTLPPAAGPLFLLGDKSAIESHAASIKSIGGQFDSQAAKGVDVATDEGGRMKARIRFENIFIISLQRQEVSGAVCQAAITAQQVEEGMYKKYFINGAFDKKKYLAHFYTLVRNLKEEHNDDVVSRKFCCVYSTSLLCSFLNTAVQQHPLL